MLGTMEDYYVVEGFLDLTLEQRQLFVKIHKRHQSCWGSETVRANMAIGAIKKVEWDPKAKCVKVYYPHEWYHYLTDGTWF